MILGIGIDIIEVRLALRGLTSVNTVSTGRAFLLTEVSYHRRDF